jgi:putative tryptophan/tyrosine transport system substrate-binding protein
MRRREFIALIGGVVIAEWRSRFAYSSERMFRMGVLMAAFTKDDPLARSYLAALTDELAKLGWTDNRNIKIDYRFAPADHRRLQQVAEELVKSQPDLIFASTTPAVAALHRNPGTIPIVFVAVSDPVGSGFVANLAKPGSNITGFTNIEASMAGKWLELLKEIAPQITRVALIFNPETAPGAGSYFLAPFEAAAPLFAVEPIAAPVHNAVEMEATVAELGGHPGSGLIVMSDVFFAANRELIIASASRHRLPAIYPTSYYARSGGLAAYGADSADLYRRAAPYIDRILKGEKPGNLPVQNPTKFELVINLSAAKALGLTVPPSLLARADEVIE